jgi:hypothetical protein
MERRIGVVTHYYDQLGVAVLALEDGLSIGDIVHLSGHSTDFIQRVESIEIDHEKMQVVGPGADVALKVDEQVHRGDIIFRVPEHEEIKGFGPG